MGYATFDNPRWLDEPVLPPGYTQEETDMAFPLRGMMARQQALAEEKQARARLAEEQRARNNDIVLYPGPDLPYQSAPTAVLDRPPTLARPEPLVLRPVVIPPDPPESEQAYEKLAAEIGFEPAHFQLQRTQMAAALHRKKMIEFFLDTGMPVYDAKAVSAYMSEVCRKINHGRQSWESNVVWYWNGLRPQDTFHWTNLYSGGHYQHLVPIEMLRRVKMLIGLFGDQATFAVTDYMSVNPDPFITVRVLPHAEHFIFGVWDEPGFGK